MVPVHPQTPSIQTNHMTKEGLSPAAPIVVDEESHAVTASAIESVFVPSALELTLLCWDYLRHTDTTTTTTTTANTMVANQYKTLASWALQQSLLAEATEEPDRPVVPLDTRALPSLLEMKDSLDRYQSIISPPVNHDIDETKESKEPDETVATSLPPDVEDLVWTPHRLFSEGGLGPTPPLALGHVVTAGLLVLQAKSRRAAEHDFVQTPLFAHFVTAVHAKGFFDAPPAIVGNPDDTGTAAEPSDALFQDRFRKVVTKFRHKLNHHQYAPPPPPVIPLVVDSSSTSASTDLATAASVVLDSYQYAASSAFHWRENETANPDPPPPLVIAGLTVPSTYLSRPVLRPIDDAMEGSALMPHMVPSPSMTRSGNTLVHTTTDPMTAHPDDLADAEALKHTGNTHMQRQEYQLAWDCYTAALERSPSGPQSHVYFANRAAAAVSLQHWSDAVADAERSLTLQPTYAKAHARLGLAHFLQGEYRYAVQAYTAALKYEPDNASSRHYLQKAAQRLAAEEHASQQQSTIGTTNSNSSALQLAQAPPSSSSLEEGVRQIPSNSSWSSRANESEKAKWTSEEKEAEKFKSQGNALMSQREYTNALDAYTKALAICPSGSQSHVYYANRAAAYCYLERYMDARDDAVAALRLQPTYGKAHARLGLALFCARDYVGAVEAYETALQYDPNNTAAASYLHKAQAKVAKANNGNNAPSKKSATTPSRSSHTRQEH